MLVPGIIAGLGGASSTHDAVRPLHKENKRKTATRASAMLGTYSILLWPSLRVSLMAIHRIIA